MTHNKKRNRFYPATTNSMFNDLFNDSFWYPVVNQFNGGSSYPAVNIRENKNDYVVELAAPGLGKKDITVKVDENKLHIAYDHKTSKKEGKDAKFVRREFTHQSFHRTFILPEDEVDQTGIDAKFDSGVLRVTVPKKEKTPETPARVIEVN